MRLLGSMRVKACIGDFSCMCVELAFQQAVPPLGYHELDLSLYFFLLVSPCQSFLIEQKGGKQWPEKELMTVVLDI